MAHEKTNILVTTFAGLSLPKTLSIPSDADLPISSLTDMLARRLPQSAQLSLTTTSNRLVDPFSSAPISSLLLDDQSDILPLRLSACLVGGKGGFGSQLRAAGGRMSSRKNRQNRERDIQGSSRNLDGRRLRTITEAKNLAEYLATKPEMDKKEREEKRRRWEAVVEAAEKKEDEIKRGKGNARLDGDWVNAKEEAETKTREAVMAAMKAGLIGQENERAASATSGSADDEESDEAEASGSGSSEEEKGNAPAQARTFYGWDDEDMSEDDEAENEEEAVEPAPAQYEGKGKGRAT
ncbi:hypothetical protein MBLNU457_4838t2 [Dothideomycetes sp. NU457]